MIFDALYAETTGFRNACKSINLALAMLLHYLSKHQREKNEQFFMLFSSEIFWVALKS